MTVNCACCLYELDEHSMFVFRLEKRRVFICSPCVGRLIQQMLGFLKSRQLEFNAPRDLVKLWDKCAAQDAEAARVEAANLPLPLVCSTEFENDPKIGRASCRERV